MANKDVVYYYHKDVGNYHYASASPHNKAANLHITLICRHHPMKPQRLQACNDLIVAYGLHRKMKVVESPKLIESDLVSFHSREYVEFLRRASPKTASQLESKFPSFNIGEDCPIFSGMYDYCTLYAGGSVEGARRLNHKLNDIVINWPGGLHHAKKGEASGFCYVNDIVLGILELLKYHKRVLYIDIDIHHGDGVQEAFNNTDRVMTVSFHRYGGGFFPGTGSIYDRGVDAGKLFAVNVPLQEGISDFHYQSVFEPVIQSVMDNFDPEAVVLQCGADSLGEDRLGTFNLSFDGHAHCVKFVKTFGRPMMVLGGGGYTLRNVARCWANETGVCLNLELPDEIPESALYYQFFTPGFQLKPALKQRHADQNTPAFLDGLKSDILDSLRQIRGAPSVQIHEIPGSRLDELELIEENDAKTVGKSEGITKMRLWNVDEEMDEGEEEAEEQLVQPRKEVNMNSEYTERSSGPFSLLRGFTRMDNLEEIKNMEKIAKKKLKVEVKIIH